MAFNLKAIMSLPVKSIFHASKSEFCFLAACKWMKVNDVFYLDPLTSSLRRVDFPDSRGKISRAMNKLSRAVAAGKLQISTFFKKHTLLNNIDSPKIEDIFQALGSLDFYNIGYCQRTSLSANMVIVIALFQVWICHWQVTFEMSNFQSQLVTFRIRAAIH
ncbi:hypothetical protein BY458DRAFT_572949 [Sporodiniella umbellata]|nr:hypothetical protein BY458DRAFT_572949 [Sporodiniella umbellata]